jgi:hypothetical protein
VITTKTGRRYAALSWAITFALAAGAASLAPLGGCSSSPAPKARNVAPPVIRDVPSALRGTVGTEASLLKAQPVIVSGYGLVVGLKGTGGGDLPPQVAGTMERQLGLMGIGKTSDGLRGTRLEGMTPQQVLRSKDVAVVVVYAAVMPGAAQGTGFDVYVSSVNKSPEISLEGGTLWTSELRVGPPALFGGYQTRQIASARGPIFINPFAEPGSKSGVGRQDGRVLGGGTVTHPLELELYLDNESHSRARAMVQAINSRFPPSQGDPPTARGRSDRVINVTVPAAYRERTDEFLNTLLRVQINDVMPQEFAKRYVEALKNEPFLANELTWCLIALPQRAAVPFLRDLYDWPELAPRRAALRAGSLLNDATAVPHLVAMASAGSAADRIEAIDLLSRLPGPRVDQALRDQLGSRELSVRVAAYEALAERAERVHARRLLEQHERASGGRTVVSYSGLRVDLDPSRTGSSRGMSNEAQLEFDSLQGIRRKAISGKFLLDIIPMGEPLIYVTQQGRPRIVLFGEGLELMKPVLVSAWSDRLMLVSDSHSDQHRMLHKEPDRTDDYGEVMPGTMVSGKVPGDLAAFIQFIAHGPSPEDPRPGFGLTYSESVGVLHAIWGGGAIKAGFAVQDDLLQHRLLQAAQQTGPEERPESTGDAEAIRVLEPTLVPQLAEPQTPAERRPMVVPLEPPASRQQR